MALAIRNARHFVDARTGGSGPGERQRAGRHPPPDVTVVTGAAGWLGSALLDALTTRFEPAPPSGDRPCARHQRRRTPPRSDPGVEAVVGDVRTPRGLDPLFAGLAGGTAGTVDVIHAAGVIHPSRHRTSSRSTSAARSTSPPPPGRPACGGWCTCRRTARSASTRTASTCSATTSPTTPTSATGARRCSPSCVCSRRSSAGLDAVIVRPPWFYGPHQPARQTTFLRMVRTRPLPRPRRRTPAALDGLRRQPRRRGDRRRAHRHAARAGLVDRRRPTVRDRRDRRDGAATRWPTPDSTSPIVSCACPAAAGRLAERADRAAPGGRALQRRRSTCSASSTRPSPATSPSPAPSSATSPPPTSPTGCVASIRLVPRSGHRAVTVSLVTGGNGYFGQLLVERLLVAGHTVRVLDIDPTGAQPDGVEVVVADIRDPAAVRARRRRRRRRVPQRRPGAAGPRPGTCCARSTSTARWRCSTPRATPASARSCTPRRAPCSASPSHNPVAPTTCRTPVEAYGAAKLAAEWACLRAAADGLDVTIVRPRTILGHGRLGIFGILFDWIADGADPFVLGDGSNRYQFVHADDLARLCIAAGAGARPRHLQRRHRPLRHDARGDRAPLRARRHRRPRQVAAGTPGGGAHACHRAARADAVRPVPLADVRALDVVRHRPRPRPSRLDAAVVERRDARRQLRLVRRQPRDSPPPGRPARVTGARRRRRLARRCSRSLTCNGHGRR